MKELDYYRKYYKQVKNETDEEYSKRLSRINEKRLFLKDMNTCMIRAKIFIRPLKEKFELEKAAYIDYSKKIYPLGY